MAGVRHSEGAVRLNDAERRNILIELIEWRQPISQLTALMRSVPWDSDREVVQLTQAHILDVLRRFEAGLCSPAEVEDWANLIECREDIAHQTEQVTEAIYVLANPILTDPLTPALADQLRADLALAGSE